MAKTVYVTIKNVELKSRSPLCHMDAVHIEAETSAGVWHETVPKEMEAMCMRFLRMGISMAEGNLEVK